MLYLLIFIAGLILLFLFGPRIALNQTIRPIHLPDDLSDIDPYLVELEAQVPNLKPDTEKVIVWANPNQKTKTPLSIIYLHGFSASRKETYPLADELAQDLEANLFYTRLTGHGQDGQALADATVNDWLNDAVEALEIGRRLGEQIVVMGTSTGGTLATWLLAQPLSHDVLALILIAPNFGPKDTKSDILLLPWARYFVPWLSGATRAWTSPTNLEQKYWTTHYPTLALFPMMGLVNMVRKLNLKQITKPIFIIYSPEDTVVNAAKTQKIYPKFGGNRKKQLLITDTENPAKHVIAGNLRSPKNTPLIKQALIDFLTEVRQKA